MKWLPFAGAVAGAALGILIWVALASRTGSEIVYAALGVGALVGLGAAVLGSRGARASLACAGLALLAIAVGRFLTLTIVMPYAVSDDVAAQMERGLEPNYTQAKIAAVAFTDRLPEADYPQFIAAIWSVPPKRLEEVSPAERDEFRRYWAPCLRAWHAAAPTYDEWRARVRDALYAKELAEHDALRTLRDMLNVGDLLFAWAGAAAAFAFGAKLTGAKPKAAARDGEPARAAEAKAARPLDA